MTSWRRGCLIFCVIVVSAGICGGASVTQTYGVFDVTFYNNGDGNGYRTSEGNWTAQQMSDVEASLAVWQNNIADTPGRQVKVHLFWAELDESGTGVLGDSGSVRVADGTTAWNLGEYVWKTGYNPGTTNYGFDTIIRYDITAAGLSWNFGSDAPSNSEVDFRSVITHEIGHSLGFSSSYDWYHDDWGWLETGEAPYGGNYYGLTSWDKNLVDSSGNRALSGGQGEPENFYEKDDPVYFDGESAVAEYGDAVPIYAPDPFEGGSSLCHLDETALGDLLMSPFIGAGQQIRTVSDIEWAMMEDMGWTLVPEPASVLLFSFMAVICLRKKRI